MTDMASLIANGKPFNKETSDPTPEIHVTNEVIYHISMEKTYLRDIEGSALI